MTKPTKTEKPETERLEPEIEPAPRPELIEPDFLKQTTEPDTKKRAAWIREQAAAAKSAGCTWSRVTSMDGDLTTVAFEGWKVRPADEGPARFALSSQDRGSA